jgi:hypothetical protein
MTAGIFWFFNALNHDYTADLKYPISIVYDKDKLIPVSRLPSSVEFNASGYGWNFLRKSLLINQKPVFIKPLELPRKNYITSGDIFQLFSEQLSDIKINYFLQDTLFFEFDYVSRRNIFLKPDTHNLHLAADYRIIGKIEIKPDSIYCTGPAGYIKSLPDTMLLHLPFDNVAGSFEETVPVDGFLNASAKLNHPEVLIKFETKKLEKRIKQIRVIKENFPQNYRLSQDSIAFVYYVDPDKKEPDEGDFIVVADFSTRFKNGIKLHTGHVPDYVEDYERPGHMTLKKLSPH